MPEEKDLIINHEPEPEVDMGLEVQNGLPEESEEIRGLGLLRRSWNMTLDFEESHPWLFFGVITVIIFLLIVSFLAPILSSVVDSEESQTITESQNKSPEVTVKVQESVGKEALQKSMPYTAKEGYLLLIEDSIVNLDLDLRGSGFLESELLALRDAEIALQYNIQESLQISNTKAKTYQDYLGTITKLEKEVSANSEYLISEKTLLDSEIASLELELKENTSALNQSLAQGSKNEILDKLDPYSQNKEDLALLRNRLSMVLEILNSSQDPLAKLRARAAGLKANKQALLAGIEIIDIDNSGLQLIKKG
ncbi:MAG: hypothetical protein PHU71_04635, partial [Candidatus Gracilibacteria bacterium]|nr:hypothetical protein [Candidatus Gracilibacteria bacterium]